MLVPPQLLAAPPPPSHFTALFHPPTFLPGHPSRLPHITFVRAGLVGLRRAPGRPGERHPIARRPPTRPPHVPAPPPRRHRHHDARRTPTRRRRRRPVKLHRTRP